MKTCAICGAENERDAKNCAKCGEASWLFYPMPEVPARAPVVAAEPIGSEPTVEAKPKKGRR